MKKTAKFFLATALVMAVTSMAAFAQASSRATAWTIRDDVDYATDYRYYKDANVNNYLLSTNISTYGLNLGFGKQFEKNYLGISYDGNLWGSHTTESVKNGDTKTTNHKEYDYYNYFTIFGGFSNMSLGLQFNFGGNKEEIKWNTGKYEKTINVNPVLLLSGNFKGEKNTAKPYINFGYKYNETENENDNTFKKYNGFNVLLGSDFVSTKDKLYSIFNVNYNFDMNKNNKYNNITDKYTGADKYINNTLALSYKVNYTLNDKIVIGGKFYAGNNFNFGKELDDDDTETSSSFTYSLNPMLSAGLKYEISPSKFALLLGTRMQVSGVEVTTKETKTNTKETNTTIEGFYSDFHCGFNWNLTDKVVLDLNSKLPTDGRSISDFTIDIGLSYRK